MSKYRELKEKARTISLDGIFFAFDNKQFIEGCIKCGYLKEGQTIEDLKKSDIKLVRIYGGGYGTEQAIENMHKKYEQIDNEIKEQCDPNEIFEYEYWNHECGYTGDWTEALNITQAYFPDYTPTRKLLNKLQKDFNKCNC